MVSRMALVSDYWLAQLSTDELSLSRYARGGAWRVPRDIAAVDDERLVARITGDLSVVVGKPPLLEEFIELADASPSHIQAFARRWGMLGLCAKHDLPYIHSAVAPADERCLPRFYDSSLEVIWEPIGVWRALARELRALLTIAGMVLADPGQTTRAELWEDVPLWPIYLRLWQVSLAPAFQVAGPEVPPWTRPIADQRSLLLEMVSEWVRATDIGPTIKWRDSSVSIELGGFGLMGGIAVQLLFAVARTPRVATCAQCHLVKPVPGHRMGPRGEQDWYCNECGGRQAAQRAAERRYQQRQRFRRSLESMQQST